MAFDFAGLLGGIGSFLGGASGFFRGGGGGNQEAMNFAREQLQFQREAARHGIRWRVADAKESGVHPLYALGAPSFNASPVPFPVGDTDPGIDWGGNLSKMSQGVGRAIAATQTKAEREISELDLIAATQGAASRQLDLEMKQLQLASMKARLARDQIGPPLPGPMPAANTGASKVEPNEITASQPDAPSIGAGPAGPVSTFHRVGPGYQAFPAKGVEGLDDMDITNPVGVDWWIRNRVNPALFGSRHWSKPTMEQVRRDFPGATGVRYDPGTNLWVPTYPPGHARDRYRDARKAGGFFSGSRPGSGDSTWSGAP